MLKAALLAGVITLALGLTSQTQAVAAAAAAEALSSRKVSAEQTKAVQKSLKKLGFASTVVDGRTSKEFKNILCAWREAVGKPPTRKQLTAKEAERILEMDELPKPNREMVVGLNVNRQCQSVALVTKSKGSPRKFEKIFRVSTGASGYSTSAGLHVIQRRIDGLHNSSSYPSPSGWNMYRPAYFTSWGEAFHGSPSDSSVSWAPSSHGCVRMLQKDIDYLWRKGANAIGSKVYVYGTWGG